MPQSAACLSSRGTAFIANAASPGVPMRRSLIHRSTLALVLSLVAGFARPCAAQTINVAVDGNALTLGGNSAFFSGIPFRAVRDNTNKTITFYFKGDVNLSDIPLPIRFTVLNADYPVRFVVGNDAIFNYGLELVAGTAGAGAGGTPGSGGPFSLGLAGDNSGSIYPGGPAGTADCFGRHSSGGDGSPGFSNFGAAPAKAGIPGSPGGHGSFGTNQNPLNGGNGQGGAAGAGAPITPYVLNDNTANGGAGGDYGFSGGGNGADGEDGFSANGQPPSSPGFTGGDAVNPVNPLKNSFAPILIAGNGGGAGGGGGGGGPGNGGISGTSGGGGGGGGSTFCDDGGTGGAGGRAGGGRPGGNSGAGGGGQPGAAGGGAIEFTALGRLIVNGGSFDASGKSAGGCPHFRHTGLPW
jgi:hypothetical protein